MTPCRCWMTTEDITGDSSDKLLRSTDDNQSDDAVATWLREELSNVEEALMLAPTQAQH